MNTEEIDKKYCYKKNTLFIYGWTVVAYMNIKIKVAILLIVFILNIITEIVVISGVYIAIVLIYNKAGYLLLIIVFCIYVTIRINIYIRNTIRKTLVKNDKTDRDIDFAAIARGKCAKVFLISVIFMMIEMSALLFMYFIKIGW